MGQGGALIGRAALASLFLMSGCSKFAALQQPNGGAVVAFMTPKLNAFAGHLVPDAALDLQPYAIHLAAAAAVLELLGGILLVLDVSLGAWLLVAFLLPTSAVMHNFWDFEQHTAQHTIEFINFMKNVCIFGGLLIYLNAPRGPAYKVKAA